MKSLSPLQTDEVSLHPVAGKVSPNVSEISLRAIARSFTTIAIPGNGALSRLKARQRNRLSGDNR
jgi:hypothetical protein